jgi:hypothetical protein
VRDNCARLVFRVRDASSSRAALDMGGAEGLSEHQFIAQLDGSPVRGVAFHPSDEELRQFLATRMVAALAAPGWLKLAAPTVVNRSSEIIELAEQIEGLWLSGASKRKLAESVGAVYAGAMAGKIDRAIEYLTATAGGATTATTTEETPGNEGTQE